MEETVFFLSTVREQYGKHPVALHPLRRNAPNGKRLYRIDYADGSSWVLRSHHRQFIENDLFGWMSRSPDLLEWLQTRASLLNYLAQFDYPVPLVVPTRTGAWIGVYQEWYLFMTTFVEGDPKETTPEKMQALGASLGCLHTLPVSQASQVGVSWWDAPSGLLDALDRLDIATQSLPARWREAHTAFLQTFHTFQRHPHLPITLIHGDCWAENGIRTEAERATLIDWECAGRGIAVADLGSLLLHCHFDQFDAPSYQPDPERIAAVVRGYKRWRSLSASELALLLEAIRFSISWRGALLCRYGATSGWEGWPEERLTRWWRWYEISEEIAHLSHASLVQTP